MLLPQIPLNKPMTETIHTTGSQFRLYQHIKAWILVTWLSLEVTLIGTWNRYIFAFLTAAVWGSHINFVRVEIDIGLGPIWRSFSLLIFIFLCIKKTPPISSSSSQSMLMSRFMQVWLQNNLKCQLKKNDSCLDSMELREGNKTGQQSY